MYIYISLSMFLVFVSVKHSRVFCFFYFQFCYSRKFRAFTMITVGGIPVADRWFLLVWQGPPIQSLGKKKKRDSGVYLLGTMSLWPKTLTHALLVLRANEMRVGFAGLAYVNLKPTLKKRFGVVIGECELRSKAVRASMIAFLIWSLVVR